MSTVTTAKNTHARSTVAILATVRMIGMIMFGLLIVVSLLGTFIGAASADSKFLTLFGGLVATGLIAVFAALWYAGISWLTETLNMLTQIAKNTAN